MTAPTRPAPTPTDRPAPACLPAGGGWCRIWEVNPFCDRTSRTSRRATIRLAVAAATVGILSACTGTGAAPATTVAEAPHGLFVPSAAGPGCSPLTGDDGRTMYCLIDPTMPEVSFDVPAGSQIGRVGVFASAITGPGAKVTVTGDGDGDPVEIVVNDSRVHTASVTMSAPLHLQISNGDRKALSGPLAVMIRLEF